MFYIYIVSIFLFSLACFFACYFIFVRRYSAAEGKLKVFLSEGLLTLDSGVEENAFVIEVENQGNKALVIESIGLSLIDNSKIRFSNIIGNGNIPYELKPDKRLRAWKGFAEVMGLLSWEGEEGYTSITAFAKDSYGRIFKSLGLTINLD